MLENNNLGHNFDTKESSPHPPPPPLQFPPNSHNTKCMHASTLNVWGLFDDSICSVQMVCDSVLSFQCLRTTIWTVTLTARAKCPWSLRQDPVSLRWTENWPSSPSREPSTAVRHPSSQNYTRACPWQTYFWSRHLARIAVCSQCWLRMGSPLYPHRVHSFCQQWKLLKTQCLESLKGLLYIIKKIDGCYIAHIFSIGWKLNAGTHHSHI